MLSKCFKPEDRERIFEIVQSERNQLQDFRAYVACLEKTRIALGQSHPCLKSENYLAGLYTNQGQYAKAVSV